jgi:hypothetical protein
MTAFSVYLFVRSTGDRDAIGATECRLHALQALRDELLQAGVRVTPLPGAADLDVEITNVFGAGDRFADGSRVLIVRLSTGDERLDFVCCDGLGRITAEHQAAKRIVSWLESLADGHWIGAPTVTGASASALS